MAQNKKDIIVRTPIIGLNKDSHPSRVEEGEYSHAMNSNVSTKDGMEFFLTSEPSNLLVTKIKEGFKVVGYEINYNRGVIYYLLLNEETGTSEIGKVRIITDNIDLQDNYQYTQLESTDEELSNIVQQPYVEYETIIEDSCNGCLGFKIDKPIHSIIVRHHEMGDRITWTFGEEPMTLDLGKLDELLYTGYEGCIEDSKEPTCLDCDKLKVFPRYEKGELHPESTTTDGNLNRGSYEFWMAYSAQDGTELTEYYSQTSRVKIFDATDNNLSPDEINSRTRYGIKLTVNNLDRRYRHFNVAVGVTTESGTRYFKVGTYDIDTEQVVVDRNPEVDYEEVKDIRDIISNKTPIYRTSERLAELSGMLLHINAKQQKEWNLQPVVNLMGAFAEWATIETEENFYKNPLPSSNMLSRYRDEAYAEGIRFHTKSGYTTPDMPLISRPAFEWELAEVDEEREDVKSIRKGVGGYDEETRNKVWQFENTAGGGVYFEDYEHSTKRTTESVDVYTITEDPVDIMKDPSTQTGNIGGVTLPFNFTIDNEGYGNYTSVKTFVEENYTRIVNFILPTNPTDADKTIIYLKELLTRPHQGYDPSDIPLEKFGHDGNCEISEPTGTCCGNVNEEEDGKEIVLEETGTTEIEVEYFKVSEYPTIPPPSSCYIVEMDSDGKPLGGELFDWTFRHPDLNKRRARAYLRTLGGTSYDYSSAQEVFTYQPQEGGMLISYSLDYDYSVPDKFEDEDGEEDQTPADCPDDLINTMYSGLETDGGNLGGNRVYNTSPTITAAWFKVDITNRDQVVLHLSSFNIERPRRSVFTNSNTYRVSIFNDGTNSTPIYSKIYKVDRGHKIGIDLTGALGTDYGYMDMSSTINGNEFYVVIDSPIRSYTRGEDRFCWIDAPEGCFSISISETKSKTTTINFDDIDLYLKQRFTAECSYEVPELFRDPVNHKKGRFGYMESTETYPNNKELYDSSWLNISPSDIPTKYKNDFEKYYTNQGQTIGGRYSLKGVDFTCQEIRHFRYPDNTAAPIIPSYTIASLSDTVIYPIGIYLDKDIINAFLDIAVKNEIITQAEREDIVSYELLVGSRTGNKTVLAKGLGFDIYSYKEDRDILFSNFPFNSLGKNELFQDTESEFLKHPNNSKRNDKYTIMTPNMYMGWNEKPSEITLDGYMLGHSENTITETKNHAKWVILGGQTRSLATLLASTEVTMEILLDALSGLETARFSVGVVVEMNPAGLIANIANVAMAITNSTAKVARYRYQWLETFENMGKPINFAYRVAGVGKYTNMVTQINYDDERNNLRGLKAIKKLEPTVEVVTNIDGDRLYINNIKREQSIFVELGSNIDYVNKYETYDNIDINRANSSRFVQSDTGLRENISVARRVASPYFSLKNYLPSQYGKINNITWHTSGKIMRLDTPTEISFGGDIYLGRFADIRKAEVFSENAINIADRTPFEYSRYPRYGSKVNYFVDHKIDTQTGVKSRLIPDITNKYNLDSSRGTGGMYIKEPSKFYTHYHGVINFIVESEYNPHFRFSIKGDDTTVFYPQNSDYVAITEPSILPPSNKTQFMYSGVYTQEGVPSTNTRFSTTYNEKESLIKVSGENMIVASKPQMEYDRIVDPWKIYEAQDYVDVDKTNGRLMDAIKLESEQLLLRFENNMSILNAQADQREGSYTRLISSLETRPIEFTRSKVGYGGSQETASLQTDIGTIVLDTARGSIFLINAVPGSMPKLENFAETFGDNNVRMARWFQRNLPFKIRTTSIEGYEDINLDNNFNGVGISLSYDNLFKRVFISKKDYVPLHKDIVHDEGGFYDKSEEAIQNLIHEKEAEGYEYISRDGGKLVFEKESEDQYTACLENMKFIVEYRATAGESPCAGGHTCNRAVFDIVVNGVTVGQANMNNAGGVHDHENRPDDYTNDRDRYSEITLTPQQIEDILDISHLLDISLECACVAGVNCQNSTCHNSVSWLRLEIDGDPVYSGCPSGGFIHDYDACENYTDTIIITEKFFLPKLELDSSSFEDVGWTISFDFRFGRWISFFDFKPNWMVSLPEYVMTGYNKTSPEIYIHGMTNRSYQNYEGIQYPWVVDVPGEHTILENRVESMMYMMEAYRHDSEYYGNYVMNPRVSMDEAIIYGTNNNSGILELQEIHTPQQSGLFPIQVDGKTQRIAQSLKGGLWSYNYFYNRLKEGHKMWEVKKDGLTRVLIEQSLDYNKGPIIERMDGNNFAVEYKSYDSKHEKNFRINLIKVNRNVR